MSITNSMVRVYSFPMSLKGAFTPKELAVLKHGTKTNRDKKSAAVMVNVI